jgi:hypothetical protein
MANSSIYSARVWERPQTPNDAEVFKGFGGIVAPLLAGFSLSAIVTLATQSPNNEIPLLEFAVAGFTISTVLLLLSIQFSFMAVRHHVAPSDRLDWRPEAAEDNDDLEDERWIQSLDMKLAGIYSGRAGTCYNVALLAFSTALVLALIPSNWSLGRILAVAMAIAGGIIEVLWIMGQGFEPIRSRLLPDYRDVSDGAERPGPAMNCAVLQGHCTSEDD